MPNDTVGVKSSRHRLTRFLADRLDPRFHLGLGLTVNVVVFGLAVWALSGLLEAVLDNELLVRVDANVEAWFHAHATVLGLTLFNAITQLGSPVVDVIIVGVALYLWRKHEMLLLWTWLGANLGGKAIQFVIKDTVHRSRPQYAAAYLHGQSYSFPSGHTMGATICYLLLAYTIANRPGTSERRQRAAYITAGVIIVAVALSRLYLGLHYPSDVLGGMAAGLAWLSVCGAMRQLVASRQAWQPAGVLPLASDLTSSRAGSSAEPSDR